MTRRHIAFTLLLSILSLTFASSSPGQSPGSAASTRAAVNARSFVVERGAGNKVKVRLLDGTRAEGTVIRIGDSTFELASSRRKQISTLAYENVAEIKNAGWSNVAKIALGIGIGVAAVVTVVAVAVATVDLDPFPDGFRKNK